MSKLRLSFNRRSRYLSYEYGLVAGVSNLRSRVVEDPPHVKTAEIQSPPAGVVWLFVSFVEFRVNLLLHDPFTWIPPRMQRKIFRKFPKFPHHIKSMSKSLMDRSYKTFVNMQFRS
ncbi:hypothetical protein TNCV_2389491 [Trichonephila clavipes]|nr:hypothetical protein TNCV_2389491 [Trichonephila clavipes]